MLIFQPKESHTRRALWKVGRRVRRALDELVMGHPRPGDLGEVEVRLETGERYLAKFTGGKLDGIPRRLR